MTGECNQVKRWGVFNGGQDKESSVHNNEEQGTVGPSVHCYGQTFGINNSRILTKGVLNYLIFGRPGGGRGVAENNSVNKIPF